MNTLAKLAIVGRPNVGKSALFNRLCGKRISIVDDVEGVTRDRIYATADCFGHPFEIIDTGGIDPFSTLALAESIRRQAEIAIEEADRLIFVVDGRVGITPLDEEIAHLLHLTKKPVCLAVNKIDHNTHQRLDPFLSLGFSKILPVSALHGFRVADLLELAFEGYKWDERPYVPSPHPQIALIGKPNVGKSTLMNTLAGQSRCVVSEIPGTTRDSVDVLVTHENSTYCFIDTAGVMRKKKEKEVLDKFSTIRTEESIQRANLCLLLLDATQGITAQEKKIANHIEASGKGCILVLNKWDLVKGFRMEHCLKDLHRQVPFLEHCPTLFISAKEGRNISKLYPLIDSVLGNLKRRISTGELNRFLEKTLQQYHPPMLMGKRLRIYYIAQIGTNPPQYVLFVNKPDLMVETYKKYLLNSFRSTFDLQGIPLHFILRGKVDRHAQAK